jgi:hypothetical protein
MGVGMDIEFDSGDSTPQLTIRMQVNVLGQLQALDGGFDMSQGHPQIKQGSQKHIATDAGETIEIKGFGHGFGTLSGLVKNREHGNTKN